MIQNVNHCYGSLEVLQGQGDLVLHTNYFGVMWTKEYDSIIHTTKPEMNMLNECNIYRYFSNIFYMEISSKLNECKNMAFKIRQTSLIMTEF